MPINPLVLGLTVKIASGLRFGLPKSMTACWSCRSPSCFGTRGTGQSRRDPRPPSSATTGRLMRSVEPQLLTNEPPSAVVNCAFGSTDSYAEQPGVSVVSAGSFTLVASVLEVADSSPGTSLGRTVSIAVRLVWNGKRSVGSSRSGRDGGTPEDAWSGGPSGLARWNGTSLAPLD